VQYGHLPRNGLSICRIIVFGITGLAMPADINLRIRSTCPGVS
jgi:hypothetical protein